MAPEPNTSGPPAAGGCFGGGAGWDSAQNAPRSRPAPASKRSRARSAAPRAPAVECVTPRAPAHATRFET